MAIKIRCVGVLITTLSVILSLVSAEKIEFSVSVPAGDQSCFIENIAETTQGKSNNYYDQPKIN